jgi:uncharacterized protein (DUF342 family)
LSIADAGEKLSVLIKLMKAESPRFQQIFAKLASVICIEFRQMKERFMKSSRYCYAHLLREIIDLGQKVEINQEVKNYTSELKICLTDAMKLRNRKLNIEEYEAEAEKIRAKIMSLSERKLENFGARNRQSFFVGKE